MAIVTDKPVQHEGALKVGTTLRSLPWMGALPVVVAIFTYFARVIYLNRSFDIFIDEVTYLQIARAIGFRQKLDLAGQPFFLHPPAWFFIEGGYIRLLNITGNLIAQIYATRYLVVAFAALSGVLVFLIVRRAAGWQFGLAAALLFALDPFIIKLNSLNMLETSAMAWALAGYWTLISGLRQYEDSEELRTWQHLVPGLFDDRGQQIELWRALLAGLFFGLALLTKEMMAFVVLLPLAIFFVLRWSLTRRALAIVGGVALAVYAVYPTLVAAAGQWDLFVMQKTHGVVRFAGLVRSTGFKRAGGPSLTQTALDRLTYYGATYVLLVLGVAAILVLLQRRGSINRVIAVWAACTYAMLAFNIFIGTLEEQFFYYLVVVCMLANVVAAAALLRSAAAPRAGRTRTALHAALAFLVLASVYNGYQWAGVHLEPNDGFDSVLDFLHAHVRHGQRVASTSETGQYVLQGYLSGPWGTWSSVDQLKQYAPDYVVVTPHTVTWNNRNTAQALLDWVEQNGQQVYVFNGRESNTLRLYRLPWATAPMTETVPSELPALGAPVGVPITGTEAAPAGIPVTATVTALGVGPTPDMTAAVSAINSLPPAEPAQPAPTAAVTATLTPTATVAPTSTAAPTATLAPTSTAAPTATLAPTSSTVAPTATALPPTAAPAPTATMVPPTATLAPTPTLPLQNAAATATQRPQLAVQQPTAGEVAQAVAAAEATLQTGHLEATIYYGGEIATSSAKMDFDFGNADGRPGYHLITSYAGGNSTGTVERLAAGDGAWQRQGNGPWQRIVETEGPWGQVQPYLPHASSATNAFFVNGDRSPVEWYDPERDADVIVNVDPSTGEPLEMRRVLRSNRALLLVKYGQWNMPVHIAPPGQ